MEVPGLLRHRAGNLVGSYRESRSFATVAIKATQKHQGHRDTEPQEQQRKKCTERNSTTGTLSPQNQVQKEQNAENSARVKESSEKCILLPLKTTESLVQQSRVVASEGTHENEQQNERRYQRAAVGRTQQSKQSECQRGDGHPEQLGTSTNKDTRE